jgi:hypothetical protein
MTRLTCFVFFAAVCDLQEPSEVQQQACARSIVHVLVGLNIDTRLIINIDEKSNIRDSCAIKSLNKAPMRCQHGVCVLHVQTL